VILAVRQYGQASTIVSAFPGIPFKDNNMTRATQFALAALAAVIGCMTNAAGVQAQSADAYKKALEGYEKVVSTTDGKPSMYTIWKKEKDGEMLAELPKEFSKKKYFIALTVASGEQFAGLQAGDIYVYWKQYGDRLALIAPNLETRSTGDEESKSSVERLFTGAVLVDVPIVATSPSGQPVIDMDELLVKNASKFFDFTLRGVDPARMLRLKTIVNAKAFPKNVELAFEIPAQDGQLKTLHYSISEIPDKTGYTARTADDRVGYFTTAYDDLGKYKRGETRTRYINRWHLEKADANLKVSPPKEPIVFYLEHTTPIRYRRFVRDGVLYWNNAFEKIGIVNAIEVYYQDKTTGAHMDKDPEDVRYNFIRWLNNNVGTAIGPSRVHPLTGQILDADIVLTDGWIRHFEHSFSEILPKFAMEGFGPEALSWLEQRPNWDPRLLLVSNHERNMLLAERVRRGVQPLAGHPLGNVLGNTSSDAEHSSIGKRASQVSSFCMAAQGRAFDLALLRMSYALLAENFKDQETDELDGIPARFIGPLLADLVAHEVGHTLGLRHNFKASSLYSLAEINSDKIRGKKPFAASVMDYIPLNIDMKDGDIQGDYTMIGIGPYDFWAIEYGYTFDKDLKPILARCVEPEHQYSTDQDTIGPDPLARRYDFTSNPLDYAKNQTKLTNYHRGRLLDKFVKDGESWSHVRRGYELTLALQVRSLGMMANWIGGTSIRREHKGDKGNRAPIEAVPAKMQREALQWVIDHAFVDEVFGLKPELLQHMKNDTLSADESFRRIEEGNFPIHDRIMGIQGSVLTMLMNPITLRRIHDNEMLIDRDKDALTMPELLEKLADGIFKELKDSKEVKSKFTNRSPMISSLRRNLQREYVERLIDLTQQGRENVSATKPISTLAMMQLRDLNAKIETTLKAREADLDAYSRAHLRDANTRITKALDAQYIINSQNGMGGLPLFLFGNDNAHRCTQAGCSRCMPPDSGSWSDAPRFR